MKLNPECIRDLMLFLEEQTKVCFVQFGPGEYAAYHELCPALFHEVESLRKYPLDEIFYHVVQLSESGYIVSDYKFDPLKKDEKFQLSRVYYITPKGHEFIAAISEKSRWEKTLKILKPLGGISLSIIEAVASGITSAAIASITGQK